MSLTPGSRLGPYEVLQLLGSGGMGEVYSARDVNLQRVVALKVLPDSVAADPGRLARFEREARLASSLNHPNIITIHGIGREGSVSYIAMELIEGQTLKAAHASGAWPIERVIDTAAQIASGLAKAHDAGIVHRDLKPQNVMITTDGFVKVLDFGLSTLDPGADPTEASTMTDAGLTRPGAVLGTVHYMSPEQAAGRPADFRSDQFSFGVVLYELLTGRRPFEARTSVQVLSKIIEAAPASLAECHPAIPDRLVAIVDRCLSKQPEGRYDSTQDLVRDLQGARDNASVTRSAIRVPPRRSRSAAAWIVGTLLVAAAAAAAVPSVRSRIRWPFSPAVVSKQPIAVLPFANVGKDPVTQAFSDGLVEVLTTQLSQMARLDSALEVVPATDVRNGHIADVQDARRVFQVSRVITGSVQSAGAGPRITVNLVDAAQPRVLEGRSIDFGSWDAGAVQDRLLREVASMLGAVVPGDSTLAPSRAAVPRAFDAYVRGRGFLRRFEDLDNVNQAIEFLQASIAADPGYAQAHAGLGEAFWRKWELTKNPSWSEMARASAETAVQLGRDLPAVHVTMALVSSGLGRYEDAVSASKRAIDLDPLNSDAYRELAKAHQALGRDEEAEKTYRSAIAMRPNYWATYNELGRFYFSRGRYPEAEVEYRRVVDLTPDSEQAYRNLGAVYHATGRYDAAVAMYEKSLALKPNSVAFANLGTLHFMQGDFAKAARVYERSLALNDRDSLIWVNFASALYWSPGERDRAAEAYAKALALTEEALTVNPLDRALLIRMADCESRLGRAARARDLIARAISLAPPDRAQMFKIGQVFEQIGDRRQAIAWINKALASGYSREAVERSPDLRALRTDARFATR